MSNSNTIAILLNNNSTSTPISSPILHCYCNKPAVRRWVSKQNKNHGRSFFGCRRFISSTIAEGLGCGFFCWAEDGSSNNDDCNNKISKNSDMLPDGDHPGISGTNRFQFFRDLSSNLASMKLNEHPFSINFTTNAKEKNDNGKRSAQHFNVETTPKVQPNFRSSGSQKNIISIQDFDEDDVESSSENISLNHLLSSLFTTSTTNRHLNTPKSKRPCLKVDSKSPTTMSPISLSLSPPPSDSDSLLIPIPCFSDDELLEIVENHIVRQNRLIKANERSKDCCIAGLVRAQEEFERIKTEIESKRGELNMAHQEKQLLEWELAAVKREIRSYKRKN
ncbi:hypothetical protein G9A89_015303 [Geosiphon pyriformis]|nr:hypothetical protein G9A89_015303 [Geosiphon pyriformis]